VSLSIHNKYKNFDSTVQRAEDRRQKFHFCRLPFAVNVMLNLTNISGHRALGINHTLTQIWERDTINRFFVIILNAFQTKMGFSKMQNSVKKVNFVLDETQFSLQHKDFRLRAYE